MSPGGEHGIDAGTLTAQEARILEHVASGLSSRQIAATLRVSRKDIDYHVDRLFQKLGCNTRPSLVAKAYSLGYLPAGRWPPKASRDPVQAG